MTTYDAVVVGAGPAGSSAAEVVAQGGARVLLLEKATLPRYKACGGGLTARVAAWSPTAVAYRAEAQATTLALMRQPHAVECPLPVPVGMVMRDQFDAFLARRAVAAGAELRDGTALAALEQAGEELRLQAGAAMVRARYVIGADGANGVTARLAGFPPPLQPATAIEVELAVPDDAHARYATTALFDFGALPGGYGWIFPKPEHLSVGVGAFAVDRGRALRATLEQFLASHPALAAGKILRQRGHRIPLAGSRQANQRGPVLLAGDAAGLADPLTGEGISYALASGRRAGASVLAALAGGPEALTGYDRYLTSELGGDLRYARLLGELIYRAPGMVIRMGTQRTHFLQMCTLAVLGQLDYRSIAVHLAHRTPTLLRLALRNLWT